MKKEVFPIIRTITVVLAFTFLILIIASFLPAPDNINLSPTRKGSLGFNSQPQLCQSNGNCETCGNGQHDLGENCYTCPGDAPCQGGTTCVANGIDNYVCVEDFNCLVSGCPGIGGACLYNQSIGDYECVGGLCGAYAIPEMISLWNGETIWSIPNVFSLTNDSPLVLATFFGDVYPVELISLGDSNATIKITSPITGENDTKTINEGQSKFILDIKVGVANTSNSEQSAELTLTKLRIIDVKDNKNNGAGINGVETTEGMVGEAFLFDGNSSYIQIPLSEESSPSAGYSIGAWARPLTLTPGAAVISSNSVIQIGGGNNPWQFNNAFNLENQATVGQWDFLVGVQEGAEQKLYVNGVLVASAQGVSSIENILDIGRRGDGVYFDGDVDEVMFFDKALSQNEIYSLYTNSPVSICLDSGTKGYQNSDCTITNITTCSSLGFEYCASIPHPGLTQCCTDTISCTDSDGGLDYYTAGNLTSTFTHECEFVGLRIGEISVYDSCFSSTTLWEYSCPVFPGDPKLTTFECTNGCLDGACNPCGNGLIDPGEECDGANLNNETCESLPFFISGELACNSQCQFDTSACCNPVSGC